jgi:hypothetical protein
MGFQVSELKKGRIGWEAGKLNYLQSFQPYSFQASQLSSLREISSEVFA